MADEGSKSKRAGSVGLVLGGLALLLLPVATCAALPEVFFMLRDDYLRIIAALGGGMLGSAIPGLLRVEMNAAGLAIRATSSLALVVLFYCVQPAARATSAVTQEVEPVRSAELTRPALPEDRLRAYRRHGVLETAGPGLEDRICVVPEPGWRLIPASAKILTVPPGARPFGSEPIPSDDGLCWRIWLSRNPDDPVRVEWTASVEAVPDAP